MNPFDGLLLINKPKDWTSHDVVGKCRRILKTKAVGHAGTLDPMATGLLVLMVGNATKFSQWILSGDKSYIASICFGTTTDSWDITGEIKEKKTVDFSKESFEEAISELTGKVSLPVPIFSAIKKDGKKLYEYARKGQEIEEVRRDMDFKSVEVLELSQTHAKVKISCAKGGYIRSFAHVLGQKLECGACLDGLERVASSPYKLDDSMDLLEFEEKYQAEENLSNMIPLNQCLPEWPEVSVDGRCEKLLLNGSISNSVMNRLKWVDRVGIESGRITSLSREKLGIKLVSGGSKKLLSLVVPKDAQNYKIARVFKN